MVYRRYEYPEPIMDVARWRVRGLLHIHVLTTANLETMLMSAYLQGVVDAAEATGECQDASAGVEAEKEGHER